MFSNYFVSGTTIIICLSMCVPYLSSLPLSLYLSHSLPHLPCLSNFSIYHIPVSCAFLLNPLSTALSLLSSFSPSAPVSYLHFSLCHPYLLCLLFLSHIALLPCSLVPPVSFVSLLSLTVSPSLYWVSHTLAVSFIFHVF